MLLACPTGQASHLLECCENENLPSGHAMHSEFPWPGAWVPAGHASQPVEPLTAVKYPGLPACTWVGSDVEVRTFKERETERERERRRKEKGERARQREASGGQEKRTAATPGLRPL